MSQEKLVQLVITSYNNQEAGAKKAEPFHDKATMGHLAHRPMEHVQGQYEARVTVDNINNIININIM